MMKSNQKPMTKEEAEELRKISRAMNKNIYIPHTRGSNAFLNKLQKRYNQRHKPQMLPASVEKQIYKHIEKELNKNA